MARPKPSLEALEARHAACTREGTASAIRKDARQRAAELGVPEPAWCAKRPFGKSRGAGARADGERRAAPAPHKPIVVDASALELLAGWRTARPGRCVQIGAAGVTLHDNDLTSKRYTSIAAALAAVQA